MCVVFWSYSNWICWWCPGRTWVVCRRPLSCHCRPLRLVWLVLSCFRTHWRELACRPIWTSTYRVKEANWSFVWWCLSLCSSMFVDGKVDCDWARRASFSALWIYVWFRLAWASIEDSPDWLVCWLFVRLATAAASSSSGMVTWTRSIWSFLSCSACPG